ncbi:NADH-quinone oxidoreductase subunit L [Yersinia pseudotuberculosis]|uniref:NADH-quinone oxidoreductase subunit L n=1 Tax=Yersinia pseudotuberculosis TaxID=633 RepID=A0ABN5R6K5_YERPU|nr:NADH-quinone oxidoreductase subunit L [Yersinia pseudotuberculosis]AIN13240.1 NADH-quinone oxidoreductase subunit L [Yersinia pseudotuberculosis]AYW92653.1 NADH-quinone oxidoreductase subunit L [Yersinia pseudotuberculosis]AYW96875.1 NADH-quinone oxidoreductase subunit L [Yersinia pseudotuberculosis]KGA61821.1 NADH-quinone oxidoreductase subunit L [Yersinia pseudotuberculosis]MBO1630752.1 NADH-quinone oxidoreductase subunit L [Yersinia pseudotuberculosis]
MNLLYLTILLPLLGFLLLAFSRGRWSENTAATVGVGSIGLTALVTLYVAVDFLSQKATGVQVFNQTLWNWMSVGTFNIPLTLTLDGLSLTMLSVVTGVGFLIHMYASWYMRGEEGYSRFFAYTNLFIASMVVLVLADNLLLMYLGWEGVGLCSYLLIGFYYKHSANGAAAMKAFIVTRVGDVFLAFALFILYQELGTLNIRELMILAPQKLEMGSTAITWATLMLLGGAVGKSAQLPLQTWLADAMAGPTPVSALIHAATMVTAGVYLIARTHGLFLMAPEVLHLVGVIGAVTLVLAGFAALVQTDIKRVLAYSTMSQIGYMFLALGVQAWDAAIFHLMTHAFFKALLFLSSGSVILACHHEQNIFKMGGLRKTIPLVYICFLVGGAALAALPIVTAGFYSKDEILWGALASGHINLMVAGLVGAFLTALYTFRMIFIVFHGEPKTKAHPVKGITHSLPLIVLLVLSTFVGALITPPLAGVLPELHFGEEGKMPLEIFSGVLVVIGIALAAFLYLGKRQLVNSIAQSVPGRFFTVWWFHAWGFDWLYHNLFVRPYLWVAKLLQRDPLNSLMNTPAVLSRWSNRGLTVSENGQVRWYAASIGLGAVIVLALLLFV